MNNSFEPFYHVAVWGIPIPMWIICLSISDPTLGTPFGDASLWYVLDMNTHNQTHSITHTHTHTHTHYHSITLSHYHTHYFWRDEERKNKNQSTV
jgi:hypothetical protein